MKERPILFSGPMVRAILREIDPKWQTRRVMKPQPEPYHDNTLRWMGGREHIDNAIFWQDGQLFHDRHFIPWEIGSRLWVRETWGIFDEDTDKPIRGSYKKAASRDWVHFKYKADNPHLVDGWRPSIHMPRELSRITLEITNIRAERLQDISGADAKAEGIDINCPCGVAAEFCTSSVCDYAVAFSELWEYINGNPWSANDWVWVIEFKRLEQ